MTFLTAAVVLFGAVSAVNLVLVLGVIRRLRELTPPPRATRPGGPVPRPVLDTGARPASFDAVTRDGEAVGADTVAGHLIGFLTPNCSVCHERLPGFVAYAEGLGRDRVLAVLIGEPGETAALRDALEPVARVVDEPHGGGPMQRAFAVTGLPAYYLLDEAGAVAASGTDLAGFPAAAASGAGRR